MFISAARIHKNCNYEKNPVIYNNTTNEYKPRPLNNARPGLDPNGVLDRELLNFPCFVVGYGLDVSFCFLKSAVEFFRLLSGVEWGEFLEEQCDIRLEREEGLGFDVGNGALQMSGDIKVSGIGINVVDVCKGIL